MTTGEIRVIVAGLGRTGTLSLARALETLGYAPFHLEEFILKPGTLALWKKLALEEISAQELIAELASPKWNYTATLDNPASELFREQLTLFPKARVILSLHPGGAKGWARSFRALLQLVRVQAGEFRFSYPNILRFVPFFRDFDAVRCIMGTRMRGQELNESSLVLAGDAAGKIGKQEVEGRRAGSSGAAVTTTSMRRCEFMFEGLDKPDSWLEELYENHNAAVRRTVPAEQLLEYRVSEGWEPLCASHPEICVEKSHEFPHAVNTSAGLERMRILFLAVIYGWLPTLLLLLVSCFWCCPGGRKGKLAFEKDKKS